MDDLVHLSEDRDQECLDIVEAGCLPLIVKRLQTDNIARASQAAKLISDISNVADDAQSQNITQAGAIEPLVALLAGGVTCQAAEKAADALYNLSGNESESFSEAIAACGGIPPLVALLAGGAESQAAEHAAATLCNLSNCSESRSEAIVTCGGITPLVALLAGNEDAARVSAGTLVNILEAPESSLEAIVASGAIKPLVALLSRGSASQAAEWAASALCLIAKRSDDLATQILGSLHCGQASLPPVVNFDDGSLFDVLVPLAVRALQTAQAGTDRAALTQAIERAALLGAEELDDDDKIAQRVVTALASARTRLEELDAAEAAARRARRESVGLRTAPPDEFVCPLTLELMTDPVVASDGHSYERAAIAGVLASANKKSPLTREVLRPDLVPNRALHRRIEEHEKELDSLAEQLEARMADARVATEDAVAKARAEARAEAQAEAEAETETLRKQLEEYKAAEAAGSKRRASDALEPAAGEPMGEPRKTRRRSR